MLHALSEQDENSVQTVGGFTRARGKPDAFRPKGLAKTPFGPSTTRKALGNITNFKQAPPPSSSLPPEKRGLSTSKPSQKQVQPGLRTRGLKQQEPVSKPETAQAPSKLAQRAEQYAQEGIEIRAGKSWHEQEAARVLRMQHEIEAKVDAICCWKYPTTPSMIQVPMAHSAADCCSKPCQFFNIDGRIHRAQTSVT